MNLFVFGLGYTAERFAVANRFDSVAGTVRSAEKAAALAAKGVAARRFGPDGFDPEIEAALARADAVLVTVPPDPDGDPVLRRFDAAVAGSPRIGVVLYLSTTGVYGDRGGEWVDEDAPVAPQSPQARRRAEAEEGWLALGRRAGKPVGVFRLSGIYGPGRNALQSLAAGAARRINKPGQVFNRVHVSDIAEAAAAFFARPRAGAIVNVSDDEPAPPQDVVAFAASLAGVEPPPEIPFAEAALSPMAASFYAENKRVRNRRLKDELGVRLRFPTYREGLRALREAGEGP